jgi:hypothetical protein
MVSIFKAFNFFGLLRLQRFFIRLAPLVLALVVWLNPLQASPAYAFDNPELLPVEKTPVVDLANILTTQQEESLAQNLTAFEQDTGWKLRVLTQFDRTPGRAVIPYWGLGDHTMLLVADTRGGNILSFAVGDDLYPLMPRTFWIELQTRFGNQFYVRDNGEDQAIVSAIETVEGCLKKPGGCAVVPGLPREQWILTLATSVIGGIICGFASQPRKVGQLVAWQWALILSPLWGILFIAFGIAPVITRTAEWLPLFRNIAGFAIGALVAFLAPVFGPPSASES